MAKPTSTFINCLECKNGIFMQWFENPIIAYCCDRRERMVAQAPRTCPFFKPSGITDPEIHHFDTYENHQIDALIAQKAKK